jgi:glycosyltransferase involved in cell wall biosynthesis
MASNSGDQITETTTWIEQFRQQHGRSPRILHIGNIANNAYLNAKILNRAGFECDVICYDYYHVTACPEWEDADIQGDIEDNFSPNWTCIDLQGFCRPKWFVQGNIKSCINYLVSRFSQNCKKTDYIWMALSFLNKKSSQELEEKSFGLYVQKMIQVILYDSAILIKLNDKISVLLGNRNNYIYIIIKLIIAVPIITIIAFIKIFLIPLYFFSLLVQEIKHKQFLKRNKQFLKRINQLQKIYINLFSEHIVRLIHSDLLSYENSIESWEYLFAHYDVIHAYSTDGILPLLSQVPYVAYEHGTIRDIPFQDTEQGRLCSLTYKLADWVCITNCDNIVAAKKLELNNYSFIPHPINEDFLKFDAKSKDIRQELVDELDTDFIIFHPSRQHWESQRHPNWEKGNDIFIKGFARFITEVAPKASAVFVEWGKCVDESKKLLEELGISHRIKWIPLQPNRQMIRYIHATDLLADQFYLGAFGSTMPRALACGKPAMLYLDEAIHQWCFEEMPPVINTKTPEEVFYGLQKLYLDKNWASSLAKSGKTWYAKYHSNSLIVRELSNIYSKIVMKK